MTAMTERVLDAVRKSVTVNASPEEAFTIFTEDFDSWWPRSHHIGKTPMTRGIIEGRRGGRCYTEHEDGSEADWGTVLAWDPPRLVLIAWRIAANWQFEPDLEKASEVEVRFTPVEDGVTRVDLEHRNFERMSSGAAEMRTGVGGEGGWGSILQLFAARVEDRTRRAAQ